MFLNQYRRWSTRICSLLLAGTLGAPASQSAATQLPVDEELTEFYHRMVSYHSRMDGSVPDGATIFIGDSITQALAVSAVVPNGVNYGIGGDTTRGVLARLPQYQSVARAKALVLAIGVNDLKYRGPAAVVENYRNILKALPADRPVIISAVLPVDERVEKQRGRNVRIRQINKALEELAEDNPDARFLTISDALVDHNGNLKSQYHIDDGIHLNEAGYALWIEALRDALMWRQRADDTAS